MSRLGPRVWLAVLASLTVLRLVVAAATPLSPDEAYYWVWSRALAPGYLDHPPMVALWIKAGTSLAGPGPLGVRLLGPVAGFAGSVLLYRAALDLLGDRRRAMLAAALLNATLLFGVGVVTMTPDTPLLFFWIVALWGCARLVATQDGRWWLAIGLACGLAAISKYTAGLLPAGIVLWLVWAPGAARWWRRVECWLGAGLGAAVFAPTLLWNARHGWASFAKQGGRGLVWDPGGSVAHLGELLGGQAGLATPLVFGLCVAGVWLMGHRAWLREPGTRQYGARQSGAQQSGATLLVCFSLPAALLFVEHALGDRVQANWPAVIYPAAVIAAAGLAWRPRLNRAALGLGFGLTALVYVQAGWAPFGLGRRLDPTVRLAGYGDLAAAVAARRDGAAAGFVASESYGEASLLAALLPGCTPVVAVGARWRLFDLPDGEPVLTRAAGLLLQSARRHEAPAADRWQQVAELPGLDRRRGDLVIERYRLFRVVGRAGVGASALLPCRAGRQG